jgi:peptide chain release factor subunit 1
VLDREEASFAIVYGSNIEIIETITSGIPGKHRAGGQSARRFERVIEVMTNEFYHRVAERAIKYFLKENVIDGLLVGGPGPTKNDFLDKDYLPTDLKKKVIDVIDLGYSGEEGIYELIERGKESLQKVEIVKQKEEISNFLKYLTENPKQVSIGLNETLAALDKNLPLKILIPEDLEIIKLIYECLICGNKEEILTHSEEIIKLKSELKCSKCNSSNLKFEEINETDNILEKIFESGIDLIFLSKNLNEASSIKKSFGGIVGILKY